MAEYTDWLNEVKQSREDNDESLRDITAGWDEQVPTAPKTKPLTMMTKEERELFKAVHWSQLYGRGVEKQARIYTLGATTGRMSNTNPDLSVCACGWCHMTEEEVRESLGDRE
jgi:hypothetical protein